MGQAWPEALSSYDSIHPGEVPTYPMLWAHSAVRERKFVVQADSCGDSRPGDETRAVERWNCAASRLHANLDFQLNSQSLAMCLTPEKCLGGTGLAEHVIPQRRACTKFRCTVVVQIPHLGLIHVLVDGLTPAGWRAIKNHDFTATA